MRYTKTMTTSENLLAHGYPKLSFDEIDGGAVVRLVHVFEDGRILKESLESLEGVVFGSLCDDAPKAERNYEGAPGTILESTQEEFEKMWSQAEWSPDTKYAAKDQD